MIKVFTAVFAGGLFLFWPVFLFHHHDNPALRQPERFLHYASWWAVLGWWAVIILYAVIRPRDHGPAK